MTPDSPVKVIGILPLRNQRGMLLKMVYSLFERLSVYRYGRVELNLFISEKEYMVRYVCTNTFKAVSQLLLHVGNIGFCYTITIILLLYYYFYLTNAQLN